MYNGENSHVGKMCKHVQDEFLKHYDSLNMNFYLPNSQCDGAKIEELPVDDEEDEGEEAKHEE